MKTADFIELKARCEAQIDLSTCNGCTSCSLRCTDDVQVSRPEWEALQTYLRSASPETRAHIAEVEAQDKTVDLGDSVAVTMCRYLDMRSQRCAVYPVRPLICRLLGHVEWLPCPIEKVKRILPTPHALELMHVYAGFERKTFAEWETLQACAAGNEESRSAIRA